MNSPPLIGNPETVQVNAQFHKLPMLLQASAHGCGAACFAMIAAYYGCYVGHNFVRECCLLASHRLSAANLVEMFAKLRLKARVLQLDAQSIDALMLPCILHWDGNHFVVLAAFCSHQALIHDPGKGVLCFSPQQIERRFSGFAIEVQPGGLPHGTGHDDKHIWPTPDSLQRVVSAVVTAILWVAFQLAALLRSTLARMSAILKNLET